MCVLRSHDRQLPKRVWWTHVHLDHSLNFSCLTTTTTKVTTSNKQQMNEVTRGEAGTSQGKTPKTHRQMMCLGQLVWFFLLCFIYLIMFISSRYDNYWGQRWPLDKGRPCTMTAAFNNRPKTRHLTSFGHLGKFFFCSHIISYSYLLY